MKTIHWLEHAEENLIAREIDREEVELTICNPMWDLQGKMNRRILMRTYFDNILQQTMLIRAIIEEIDVELFVVTVYKTSRIDRYTKGLSK
ncbi:MAG: DUF4258 domain-containing protein [Candidatus Electryonea clarkiae]|nr:DUF4258 domain-containing protein [Candidatus Electryonea clarkiae]MDP8286111.1 DUF4258 domain-containing protein [Candidatus Electryonea clarkiae]